MASLQPLSFLVVNWSLEFEQTASVTAKDQDVVSFLFVDEHWCHRHSVLTTIYEACRLYFDFIGIQILYSPEAFARYDLD